MKQKIFFLSFGLLFLMLISCAKKKNCEIGGLNIGVLNLNSNIDDTLLVKRYAKGSNFSDLIQTTQLIYIDSLDSLNTIFGDSLILIGNEVKWHDSDKNNAGFLSVNYDYEIITKNYKHQFSDLEILQKVKKCGGLLSLECPTCYSPVVNFKLNKVQNSIIENQVFYVEN